MRWTEPPRATPADQAECAAEIVDWVNANGGEARYQRDWDPTMPERPGPDEAHIAIRAITGWVYAKPGDYIVMNPGKIVDYRIHEDSGLDLPVYDPPPSFAVLDSKTFERSWEAIQ